MKNPIVITLLLLLSAPLVKAQDIKRHQVQPDSIIKAIPFDYGDHTSYVYTIGGQMQTPKDIKMRLLAYAPSAAEYKSARTNVTWSFVSLGGSALASTGAILEFAHHAKVNLDNMPVAGWVNGKPGFVDPPQHRNSLAGAYILTGVATALIVSTFMHFARAAKHGNRAIKVYNERFQ
jgi:hypothetical protein